MGARAVAPFDNLVWHCLQGPQRAFAVGGAAACRSAPGLSPVLAFPQPEAPDFAAIAPHCAPGEIFYHPFWTGSVPPGWRLEVEERMLQMFWAGPAPAAEDAGVVRLHGAHVPAMLALAEATRPGLFGPRNLEMGEYFGLFDGERLVAMAGERFFTGAHREISAVCTDPAYQGRGYARRLMGHLIRRERARGEQPFLHVLRSNPARGLYERMGFEARFEVPVRILTRLAD